MGYETKLSTKGQIVLPKEVRDALAWSDGRVLEVIQHPDSVTLKAKRTETPQETAEVILARIRARSSYAGPPVSDEEIKAAVAEAIRIKWQDRLK